MTQGNYERWTELIDREQAGDEFDDALRAELDACRDVESTDARARAEHEAFVQLEQWVEADEDSGEGQDPALRAMVAKALEEHARGSDGETGSSAAVEAVSSEPDEGDGAGDSGGGRRRSSWVLGGIISLVAAAAAAVALLVLIPESTTAPTSIARAELVFASGEVRVDGRAIEQSVALETGNALESGEGRACVAIDPGVDLCLGPHTRVRIEDLTTESRKVELLSGRVVAALDPQPRGTSFAVTYSGGSATAVGTVFAVERNDVGQGSTSVVEGKVRVDRGEQSTIVEAHQRIDLESGDVERMLRAEEGGIMAVVGPRELWDATELGVLIVDGRPTGAMVSVDGRELGPAPLMTLIESGEHDVALAGEGHVSASRRVVARAGESGTATLHLDALVPAQPADDASEPPPEQDDAETGSDDGRSTARGHTVPRQTVSELLAEARAARADKRWRAAAKAYERLHAQHPDTREATITLVPLADLYLDHLGAPRKALGRYQRYLDRGGPLAQEALHGKIRALRKLGRRPQERAAIERYLSTYPGSLEAESLRARLNTGDAEAGQ